MNFTISKLKKTYNEYPIIATILVFFVIFFILSISYVYDTGDTALDDHFFHFKYASLLRSQGMDAVENFDWIYLRGEPFEGNRYTISLYNVFLIPFTFIHDQMIGLKISDIFFASSFLAILYYSLRKMRIKKPLFFILLMATSPFFLIRILSGRAYVIGIALVFLEMYLAIDKKYRWLFVVAIFHVLWHQSTFFMPIIVTLIVEAARYLNEHKFFVKNMLAGVLGTCVGMLWFGSLGGMYGTVKNILTIQSRAATSTISSVGTEAVTKDFISNFVLNFELFLLASFVGGGISLYYYINIRNGHIKNNLLGEKKYITMLYAFFILLIGTVSGSLIVSGRLFDYYIPASIFLFAIVVTVISISKEIVIEPKLKKAIMIILYSFIIVLCIGSLLAVKKMFADFDQSRFQKAADWIEERSDEKDKVYLDNWSHFTVLFFYNDKNIYSTGLEPNDTLEAAPELYWKWQNFRRYLFYCEKQEYCKDDAKKYFDVINGSEREEEYYKLNSKKIIESIYNDFDSRFIVSGNGNFNKMLHYNDEMFEDTFQVKSDDGKIVLEVFQLKRENE